MLPSNVELYFNRIFDRAQKYFPPKSLVLDVGCREGDETRWLQNLGCRVMAIDIEDHSEAWAKVQNPNLKFQVASAEDLPFPAGSFDAIWAKDTLHHMENPQKAVSEFIRVAKPGAPIVIVEANRYNPLLYLHMTLWEGHEHFSRRRFRQMLAAADKAYVYFMLESRCIPWNSRRGLRLFNWLQNRIEEIPFLQPWLTYQVGIIRGRASEHS